MVKDLRIAAAICQSVVRRVDRNIDRVSELAKMAGEASANIVCFPEMNITGYSSRSDILESAERIPGPSSAKIQTIADDEKIVILAGILEKDDKNRIFASHLVVRPGKRVKKYRKIHIAPPEKKLLSAGNDVAVFDAAGAVFGIQLCYDVHFPELSGCMAARGADVIFMPHASPRGLPEEKYNSWMRHLPARAFDNGVFIIACNQAGENANGLSFPGLALAIGPAGEIIKKDVSGAEGLLVVDLKTSVLEAVRGHRMRYFFPNRRPEIYQCISES